MKQMALAKMKATQDTIGLWQNTFDYYARNIIQSISQQMMLLGIQINVEVLNGLNRPWSKQWNLE